MPSFATKHDAFQILRADIIIDKMFRKDCKKKLMDRVCHLSKIVHCFVTRRPIKTFYQRLVATEPVATFMNAYCLQYTLQSYFYIMIITYAHRISFWVSGGCTVCISPVNRT